FIMGKKRVPISLRKPPSPDAAAARVNGDVSPEAMPPAPPEPEVMAPVVVPEVTARAAEPEVAAPVVVPEVTARAAEPEVAAPVVVPEVTACAAEPPTPSATDALQRLAPEAPPPIFVGADGRAMRAVTVYLPAELADAL